MQFLLRSKAFELCAGTAARS